jgi:hypothetical protein
MAFDDETTEQEPDPTADARAEILAALDGSTMAATEAEQAAAAEDDAEEDDDAEEKSADAEQ